jgi:Uma2 family endonuclease
MSTTVQKPMSLTEFLVWEERQPLRYEFDGEQPLAMAGGTEAHAAIQRNIVIALGTRLRGTRCRPYGSDLKIEVAGRIRYPDAFVLCTPAQPRATVITQPVVVLEVLSADSVNDDLVVKNAEYRATPSIQRYIVLQANHAAVIVFARKGGDWISEPVSGADAVLHMPEIGISVPLAELYADVELDAAPGMLPADA